MAVDGTQVWKDWGDWTTSSTWLNVGGAATSTYDSYVLHGTVSRNQWQEVDDSTDRSGTGTVKWSGGATGDIGYLPPPFDEEEEIPEDPPAGYGSYTYTQTGYYEQALARGGYVSFDSEANFTRNTATPSPSLTPVNNVRLIDVDYVSDLAQGNSVSNYTSHSGSAAASGYYALDTAEGAHHHYTTAGSIAQDRYTGYADAVAYNGYPADSTILVNFDTTTTYTTPFLNSVSYPQVGDPVFPSLLGNAFTPALRSNLFYLAAHPELTDRRAADQMRNKDRVAPKGPGQVGEFNQLGTGDGAGNKLRDTAAGIHEGADSAAGNAAALQLAETGLSILVGSLGAKALSVGAQIAVATIKGTMESNGEELRDGDTGLLSGFVDSNEAKTERSNYRHYLLYEIGKLEAQIASGILTEASRRVHQRLIDELRDEVNASIAAEKDGVPASGDVANGESQFRSRVFDNVNESWWSTFKEVLKDEAWHMVPTVSARENWAKGRYGWAILDGFGDVLTVVPILGALGKIGKAALVGRAASAASLASKAGKAGTLYGVLDKAGLAANAVRGTGHAIEAARTGDPGERSANLWGAALSFIATFLHLRYCFPAGTPVATEHGLKPIEEIKVGDRVWAFDHRTGKWKLCRVEDTLKRTYYGSIVGIEVEGSSVEATADHPFWVCDGVELFERPAPAHVPAIEPGSIVPGRWVDAGDLRCGDVLILRNGNRSAVRSLSVRNAREPVYNFVVEQLHTFAVGEMEVLVHNRPGQWFEDRRANELGNKVVVRGGINRGVDFTLSSGTWLEVKAWGPIAWLKKGVKKKRGMIDKMTDQLTRYLEQSNGKVVVEFAWKVAPPVKRALDLLRREYHGRFEWLDDVLKQGGIEERLKGW